MVKATAILGVVGICALAPAVASAGTTVPPGATEGDQYLEDAPNGGGSASVDKGGGGSSGSQEAVPATQALNALGPEGQAAADLANSNTPLQQARQGKPQQPSQGKPNQNPKAQPSSSSDGEGGMGFLFPLLLVVAALAAVGYGLRRRLTPA